MRKIIPPEDRFWAKVAEPDANGCMQWLGAWNRSTGYGSFAVTRSDIVPVHRFAYLIGVGEIPEGMHIDHECHNRDLTCSGGVCLHRRCVNPEHLAAKTLRENITASPHYNGNQTHCRNGHEYAAGASSFTSQGHRRCMECRREFDRRRDRGDMSAYWRERSRRRRAAAKAASGDAR